MNKIKTYFITGEDFDQIQKDFERVYNSGIAFFNPFDYEVQRYGKKIEEPKVSLSFGTMEINIIDAFKLETFKKVITEKAVDYLQDSNILNTACWANDMKAGERAFPHHHMPNDVAGVYYNELQEGDPQIEFLFGETIFPIEGRIGKMMLWPANYLHRIPQKLVPGNRRSISFNFRKIQ